MSGWEPDEDVKSVVGHTYSEMTGNKVKAVTQCMNFVILDELKKIGISAWVAGGAIRAFFENKFDSKVDVDVFFSTKEDWKDAVDHFQHHDILRESDNSITYKFKGRPIDLIGSNRLMFDGPLETIKFFDFTVCAASVKDDTLYIHDMFFEDLKKKHLRVINLKNEESIVLQRFQKYVLKGYRASKDTLEEIVEFIKSEKENPIKQERESFWSSY